MSTNPTSDLPRLAAPRTRGTEDWSAIAIGVVLGSIVALVGLNYEERWFMMLALIVVAASVVAIIQDRRALLMMIFLLSFQADLNLYLLHRDESSSIGTSGPPGIRLALVFLAGFGLLLYELGTGRLRLKDLDLGQPVTKYATWLAGLYVLSLVAAPEKFIGLCAMLDFVQLYLIYLTTLNVLRTERDIRRAINVLMVCLLCQCLIYFLQVMTGISFDLLGDTRTPDAGGLPRHGGTVSMRAADFASFIVPLTLIAVARYFTGGTPRERQRFAVLTGVGVAAIILTFTRAAWAGTILGSCVLMFFALKRQLVSPGTIAKVGAMALTLVIAFLPMIRQRLGDNHASAYDERDALMQMAKNIIVARPILGVGIGNYSFVVRDYLTPDLEDKWLWIVHNNYLLRAAETGIPSVIVWLMMLWAMIRRAARCIDVDDRVFMAFGVGWTAGMVALTWEMYWDIWQGFPYNALMWMLWGLTGAVLRLRSSEPTEAATPISASAR